METSAMHIFYSEKQIYEGMAGICPIKFFNKYLPDKKKVLNCDCLSFRFCPKPCRNRETEEEE
jgi:hypothetical protein